MSYNQNFGRSLAALVVCKMVLLVLVKQSSNLAQHLLSCTLLRQGKLNYSWQQTWILSSHFLQNFPKILHQFSSVLLWCPIKMRAAFLAPTLHQVMKEGESKQAALILMKNSYFDRTLRYCILLFYASWQGIQILGPFGWGKNARCSVV